jgi:phosphate-selective porin OprO/OprP
MKSNAKNKQSALSAFVLTATAAAVLASFAGAARADDAPTTTDLDQRIKVLERQLEIQKEEADAKAKDATTASAGEKGFSLKKGDYEIKFSALAQVDGRFFVDDGPTDDQPASPRFNDGFRLRRLRPTIQGSLGKLVSFRFTPEFAGDGSGLGGNSSGTSATNGGASIVDAYIDLNFDPAASLRVGKQKGPIGLERLQSGGAIDFVERGYPTELVPNRDLGVALFGSVLSNTVTYTAGIFNGTRDGRDIDGQDSDNRHEFEGRIFAEPLKNQPGVFQGLGFGIGGSTGTKLSAAGAANLPQLRTPGQNVFFQYNATAAANGTETRWTPQAYWYYNNVGLLAEYVSAKQEAKNTVTAGTPAVTTVTSGKFTNDAWEVTATYVLTGEDTSYKGVVKPKNSYAIGAPGWGAFELAARYGELDVDNDLFKEGFANASTAASKASSYGVGLNWYLNSNAKIVLDYDHTKFDGGGVGGQDRLAEKAIFTRLQLTY